MKYCLTFSAVIVLVTFGFRPLLAVGTHPVDLTGKWALNVDKSNFGKGPKPSCKLIRRIAYEKVDVKVTDVITFESSVEQIRAGAKIAPAVVSEHTQTDTYFVSTDGTERFNTVGNSLKSTSTGRWQGTSLVIDSTYTPEQGWVVKQRDSWTLSSDRQTILVKIHIESRETTIDQTQIFEKRTQLLNQPVQDCPLATLGESTALETRNC